MTTIPLPEYITRCLAHTARRNEWCPRSETCARHITIRHDRPAADLAIKQRLCFSERCCISEEFEQFLPIQEASE